MSRNVQEWPLPHLIHSLIVQRETQPGCPCSDDRAENFLHLPHLVLPIEMRELEHDFQSLDRDVNQKCKRVANSNLCIKPGCVNMTEP